MRVVPDHIFQEDLFSDYFKTYLLTFPTSLFPRASLHLKHISLSSLDMGELTFCDYTVNITPHLFTNMRSLSPWNLSLISWWKRNFAYECFRIPNFINWAGTYIPFWNQYIIFHSIHNHMSTLLWWFWKNRWFSVFPVIHLSNIKSEVL